MENDPGKQQPTSSLASQGPIVCATYEEGLAILEARALASLQTSEERDKARQAFQAERDERKRQREEEKARDDQIREKNKDRHWDCVNIEGVVQQAEARKGVDSRPRSPSKSRRWCVLLIMTVLSVFINPAIARRSNEELGILEPIVSSP